MIGKRILVGSLMLSVGAGEEGFVCLLVASGAPRLYDQALARGTGRGIASKQTNSLIFCLSTSHLAMFQLQLLLFLINPPPISITSLHLASLLYLSSEINRSKWPLRLQPRPLLDIISCPSCKLSRAITFEFKFTKILVPDISYIIREWILVHPLLMPVQPP